MSEILIQLRDVSRIVGSNGSSRTILAGVDATVCAGNRIAVIGPSGSGKTTLLNIMCGIDTPTTGTVSWPGLTSPLRPAQIGVAFQAAALLPALTVGENAQLPLLIAGVAPEEAAERAVRELDRFHVRGEAGRLPEEVSGGQAHRAAVARAFSAAPRVVMLDEPTGQQDREMARNVIDAAIARAAETGAALIIATHDPDVAGSLDLRWTLEHGSLSCEVP